MIPITNWRAPFFQIRCIFEGLSQKSFKLAQIRKGISLSQEALIRFSEVEGIQEVMNKLDEKYKAFNQDFHGLGGCFAVVIQTVF